MLVIVNNKDSKFVSEICKGLPSDTCVIGLTESYSPDKEMIFVIDIPSVKKEGVYVASEVSNFIQILLEAMSRIKLNLNSNSKLTFVVNNISSNAFAQSCYLLITELLQNISSSTSVSLITTNIETMPFPNFSKMRLGSDSVFCETDIIKIKKISNMLSSDIVKDNFGVLNVINIK